jgi:type II restriction enzyme
VYALFNTITKHLNATVTLTVTPKGDILKDFRDFARLVLGVDEAHPEVRQPARLYRVGTANAADAGLDMWANFGPAVQVKHLSLRPAHFDGICESVQADQIVIVCKSVEASSIEAVLAQVGFRSRIRGVITEVELARWYGLACGEKYHRSMGRDLLRAIREEMALEFPLTQAETVDAFMTDRGYDVSRLTGMWSLHGNGAEDEEE